MSRPSRPYIYGENHSKILKMLIESGFDPSESSATDERSQINWYSNIRLPTSYLSCFSNQQNFVCEASSLSMDRCFGAVQRPSYPNLTLEKLRLLEHCGVNLHGMDLCTKFPRRTQSHTLLHAIFYHYTYDRENKFQDLELLKLLISKGLDLHALNYLSRTVTDIATDANCKGLWLEALVGSGIDIAAFMREEERLKQSYETNVLRENIELFRIIQWLKKAYVLHRRGDKHEAINLPRVYCAERLQLHEAWCQWRRDHWIMVTADSSTSTDWKAPERAGHYENTGEIKLRSSRHYSEG